MLYSTNKTLEDRIVEILSHGNKTAKELLNEVELGGEDFTIQGVYKVIRKLSKDNIVLKHNRTYILGREWSNRVIKTLGGKV